MKKKEHIGKEKERERKREEKLSAPYTLEEGFTAFNAQL